MGRGCGPGVLSRLEEAVARARGERWSEAMRFIEGEIARLWSEAHRVLVALEAEAAYAAQLTISEEP